jgi:uncharacterized membrane protein YfcA
MVGGGGGFFFLPLLTLVLNVPAQTAVITSLVATLPICIVGSQGHYRKSNINFRVALIFITGGIIGAFVGAGITSWISEAQLKTGFGIYTIVIAVHIILSTRKNQQTETVNGKQKSRPTLSKIAKGSFFGMVAGTITGTFGTSGTAPILAGLFSLKIPVKMVIGTSLLVVLFNTVFAVGAHFLISKIDLTLVYFLTAGSAIGAVAGPRLLTKIHIDKAENKARYWYAVVMVIIGVLMITGQK